MESQRSPWYLLTGFILGLILGMVIAQVIRPILYGDVHPASLNTEAKDIYRSMIAQVYTVNPNLTRAESRLALLQDIDPIDTLSAQAQRYLAQGGYDDQARALAILAFALEAEETSPTNRIPLTPYP